MLQEFIEINRDEIIRRCREKVAGRSIPPPTEAEINHGVPLFLGQLVVALRSGSLSAIEISKSAGEHGHDLLLQGFSVSQVVHDYGDVCQTITGLAVEQDAPISSEDFRTLNRCLDDAIAAAVTMYGREREERATIQHQEATGRSNERVGFLVHELRNLVGTATFAYAALKSGHVGVSGSTGAVLDRSLTRLRELIASSLNDVRMTRGATNREYFLVSEFIDEIEAAARLGANTRNLTLVVRTVEAGVAIEADRQILAAVIGNLLQNAFKFTRPHSQITLRVGATSERVLIEVEDECGGLPSANAKPVSSSDADELLPPFEQRGADRSGLGVGLAFSRWGAEVNGGRLYARNLRGKGCVFAVDLPRVHRPATATVLAARTAELS